MSLTGELADVDHAVRRHVGIAGVADVRVMRPDDRLGALAVEAHDPLERLHHMMIADVP